MAFIGALANIILQDPASLQVLYWFWDAKRFF
jgi:hypothetical protein